MIEMFWKYFRWRGAMLRHRKTLRGGTQIQYFWMGALSSKPRWKDLNTYSAIQMESWMDEPRSLLEKLKDKGLIV